MADHKVYQSTVQRNPIDQMDRAVTRRVLTVFNESSPKSKKYPGTYPDFHKVITNT